MGKIDYMPLYVIIDIVLYAVSVKLILYNTYSIANYIFQDIVQNIKGAR